MSKLIQTFNALRSQKNYAEMVKLIPYAQFMGVTFTEEADGQLLFTLPFHAHNIGNWTLPAIHGGLIGSFMENSAILHLLWHNESTETPKIINFSLDFLRSGKPEPLYVRCHFVKKGRRIDNVAIEAYQEDPNKPIAVARAHFLLIK